MTPSVARKPCTRSKSSPGVRMVTASGVPASRISSGSSAATVSGRVVCTGPADAQHRCPAGDSSHEQDGTHAAPTVTPWTRCRPYTAVVLAGGKAARLGGQAKPQLEVGGRTDARRRARRGRRRRAARRRRPAAAGPRRTSSWSASSRPAAARSPPLRAGLAEVSTDVVALLAGDLPFLTAALVAELRAAADRRRRPRRRRRRPRPVPARGLADGGAAGGGGRRRRARRRCAGCSRRWPSGRLRPGSRRARPPPWLDCDTPADLARARRLARGDLDG